MHLNDETISALLEYGAKLHPAVDAEDIVPAASGFYSIFIDEPASFPAPFDSLLRERDTHLIYVGIATRSLLKRLVKQDLLHKNPSTFFRGIAPILGFRPPSGSLLGKKNKKNYRFSPEDTRSTIAWINQHLSIRWVATDTSAHPDAEKTAIRRYRPILNTTHNPDPSPELAALRSECRRIATKPN